MAVFDRALLIAHLSKCSPIEASAEDIWADTVWNGRTQKEIERELERLLSEGVLVRTAHSTYCDHCSSEDGFEYRYAIDPAWKARMLDESE
jgi:hypothetical protein